jgi:hypothetical protein
VHGWIHALPVHSKSCRIISFTGSFTEVFWNRSNLVRTYHPVSSGYCQRCFLRLSAKEPIFSNFRAKLCIVQLAGTLRPPRHSLCSSCLTRCEMLAQWLAQGTHAPAMCKTWCSYPMTLMVERGIEYAATCHLTWTRRMNHGWARHEIPGNLQVVGRWSVSPFVTYSKILGFRSTRSTLYMQSKSVITTSTPRVQRYQLILRKSFFSVTRALVCGDTHYSAPLMTL